MTNEFKLPEKWCVNTANFKNTSIIEKWFYNNREKTTEKFYISYLYYPPVRNYFFYDINPTNRNVDSIFNEYTEITPEQFEEYVLYINFVNQNYDYLISILKKLEL